MHGARGGVDLRESWAAAAGGGRVAAGGGGLAAGGGRVAAGGAGAAAGGGELAAGCGRGGLALLPALLLQGKQRVDGERHAKGGQVYGSFLAE